MANVHLSKVDNKHSCKCVYTRRHGSPAKWSGTIRAEWEQEAEEGGKKGHQDGEKERERGKENSYFTGYCPPWCDRHQGPQTSALGRRETDSIGRRSSRGNSLVLNVQIWINFNTSKQTKTLITIVVLDFCEIIGHIFNYCIFKEFLRQFIALICEHCKILLGIYFSIVSEIISTSLKSNHLLH